MYFVACWTVAGVSGALDGALLGDSDSGWSLVLGLVALGVAYVGYWVVWPMGSFTADRELHPAAAAAFGVLHGVSEGALYVAIWFVLDREIDDRVATVVASLLAVAAFNGIWRTFVWDVWVTPPHNVEAWNLRKVAFVHVPVLTLALVHGKKHLFA